MIKNIISFPLLRVNLINPGIQEVRLSSLSSIQNALRPFYFKIHPDFFGQNPRQQATNEQSLKLLNSYLEVVTTGKHVDPVTLTFYVRNDQRPDEPSYQVSVRLDGNFNATLERLLGSCGLPSLKTSKGPKKLSSAPKVVFDHDIYAQALKNFTADTSDVVFSSWIKSNWKASQDAALSFMALEIEIDKVKYKLCEILQLKEIIWECGWNLNHYRGCLNSFQTLVHHHKDVINILKGKTLVFGRDSGVSLVGNVILNTGEVRKNWLDVMKRIPEFESTMKKIPFIEKSLSGLLGNINIVHRKYEPVKLVSLYEARLKQLITLLSDYRGINNYPSRLPDLSQLELVVETEACPLMLSPAGQFIVPSSCYAVLLIEYLIENHQQAGLLLHKHKSESSVEADTVRKCMVTFSLRSLDKADNILPKEMIECCQRLMQQEELKPMLHGSRIHITQYYSLQESGVFCIPWDFRSV